MVQERLKVAVTKVTGDGAVLSWETTVGQQHALTCSLHYGPQTEAMLVKTEVRTSAKNIKLAHLSPHTTYHASLNCSQAAATYKSNTVHFTPHGDPAVALEVRPPPSPPPPRAVADSSSWSSRGGKDGESAGDGGIVVMMSQRHMNAPRRDPHSAVPSTSVILGAVCGVVGFLIINVTVVMAVRQYSHRRARRRRLLELQKDNLEPAPRGGNTRCGQVSVVQPDKPPDKPPSSTPPRRPASVSCSRRKDSIAQLSRPRRKLLPLFFSSIFAKYSILYISRLLMYRRSHVVYRAV
ncbi:uncharacterized protein LOC135100854 isoform X2 [Scylla paramamosain]